MISCQVGAELDIKTNLQKVALMVSHLSTLRDQQGLTSEMGQGHVSPHFPVSPIPPPFFLDLFIPGSDAPTGVPEGYLPRISQHCQTEGAVNSYGGKEGARGLVLLIYTAGARGLIVAVTAVVCC